MGDKKGKVGFIAPEGRVCVVFGAGPFDPPAFDIRPLLGDNPLVICADGGLENARMAGFHPDIVIGDFDSAGSVPEGVQAIALEPEKDETDLKVSIDYALEKGCETFFLLCCTGGRLDHFFANAFLLESLCKRGCKGYILNSRNIIGYAAGPCLLEFEPAFGFRYFSVVPVDPCRVSFEGLKYPLKKADIRRDEAVWVSNEPAGEKIVIELESGNLIIIFSN